MKKDTVITNAGRPKSGKPGYASRDKEMVNTPVYRASTILYDTVADLKFATKHKNRNFYYGRRGTPTQWSLRDAMVELDGGHDALLHPSGLAAVTTAILAFVRAGDHILMADTCYEPTRIFCNIALKKINVETTFYDPLITGPELEALMQDNTTVVFVETPGSLTFEVSDLPAIAAVAKKHGAKVLVDNTWATPMLYRPLEFGADVVIHAATKYLVGHSDAMLGITVCNEASWDAFQRQSFVMGQCAAPDDVYLASRGLRTLAVRMRQHEANALKIAKWLQTRPEVHEVRHPALETCPGHDIWKRDFDGASGLFSIILTDKFAGNDAAVAAMIDGLELFGIGYSWGGFESLALPANPTGERTAVKWQAPGPLIRFHIGLEDVDDLQADLEAGFERLNNTP
jgi:cysteine-S-conjugate beta-lyase